MIVPFTGKERFGLIFALLLMDLPMRTQVLNELPMRTQVPNEQDRSMHFTPRPEGK